MLLGVVLPVPRSLLLAFSDTSEYDDGTIGDGRTTKNASPTYCSNAISINSNDNSLLLSSVGSVMDADNALSSNRPGTCLRCCCSSVISAGNSLLDSLHKDRNK